MCIAGDFNQNRDCSGWYEEKQSVEMLSEAFRDLSLVCVTEENFQEKGLSRSTVDHICLSKSLVPYMLEVGAWEGENSDGRKMSDHNGVFVDLQCMASASHLRTRGLSSLLADVPTCILTFVATAILDSKIIILLQWIDSSSQ